LKALLALFLLLGASAACAETLRGVVIVVIDGDTVLFKPDTYHPSSRAFLKVRLVGIDAPERDQPHGDAASAALRALALKRSATLEIVAIDIYQRKLGRLAVEGRDINTEMIRIGRAWASARDAEDPLRVLQREAQAARIGLWQDDAPVPPWRWRRGIR
jgi:endonuclease YncB( thermonuclease family)